MASKEWDLKRAEKEWVPQTRPVQHVGVPGYQWQTAVMWDGSLALRAVRVSQDRGVSRRADREILGGVREAGQQPAASVVCVRRRREVFRFRRQRQHGRERQARGRAAADTARRDARRRPRVGGDRSTRTYSAGAMADGMKPRPDDVLVTHAAFTVRNKGAQSGGRRGCGCTSATRARCGSDTRYLWARRRGRRWRTRSKAPFGMLGRQGALRDAGAVGGTVRISRRGAA